MLDAYGEFVDSPIGPLELQNLNQVFARILDNLSQRFPDIASKRAASTSRDDIMSFLAASNGDPERVKQILRAELTSVGKSSVVPSIAERFSRMNTEERRATDATLRLIRRSSEEILFRAEAGKHLLSSSGGDFARFFASVNSESPSIKELRYENLIVEKAIFNKLILKSKDRDYWIWVPSYFVKQSVDSLIQRLGVPNEHLLHSRLKELEEQARIDSIRDILDRLSENLGVLPKTETIPDELSDFVRLVGNYSVLPPIDLDDMIAYFDEIREREERARIEEEKRERELEQNRRDEFTRKQELQRQRLRPSATQQIPVVENRPRPTID